MSARDGLNAVMQRKPLCLLRESNLNSAVVKLIAYSLLTDPLQYGFEESVFKFTFLVSKLLYVAH
jgi:hypothetical protein